jgi:hypothetical protein
MITRATSDKPVVRNRPENDGCREKLFANLTQTPSLIVNPARINFMVPQNLRQAVSSGLQTHQPVRRVLPSGLGLILTSGLAVAPVLVSSLISPLTSPVMAQTTGPQSTGPQTTGPQSSPAPSANQPRFRCDMSAGRPVVMYYPESRPSQGFAWATPAAMGGGWSADRRCAEISRRLEQYRPDGLTEMRTSLENGYNTVCATTDRNPACRIIFTVPRGQDPVVTRDSVFQNLLVADRGGSTQPIATFAPNGNPNGSRGDRLGNWIDSGIRVLGGSDLPRGISPYRSGGDGIALKPFLDARDGGTGSSLVNPATQRPNPRFNW